MRKNTKFEIRIISKCKKEQERRFFAIVNCIIEKGSINMEQKTISIDLTLEEAEVVDNYIFKKVCRLEDADLRESYCYPRLYNAHRKLSKAIKDAKEEN